MPGISNKSKDIITVVEDKVTPEEKLLKVIENPRDVKEKGIPGIRKSPKDIFLFKKGWPRLEKDKIKALISLKNTYKTLGATSVLMTILVAFIFIKGYSDSKRRFKNIESVSSSDVGKEKERYALAVDLTEAIKDARRNIFISLPIKSESAISKETEQAMTNLKLVGIIWSNNPQIMIENINEQRTYLLSTGEQIGQHKVKKIFRDRVILEIEGQEQELR